MRILTENIKTIRERVDINAPINEVFDFTQDYRDKEWDPFVREITAHPLKNGFPQEGTKVEVTAWHGMKMKVDYIRYDRPRCVAIKMTKGGKFLRHFAGTWRFLYIDHERTAVVFLYQFKMVKGFGWLEPFAKAYFRIDMARRLRALKRELELKHQEEARYGTGLAA